MDDLQLPSLPRAELPAGWPQPEALAFGAYLAPLLVSCEHDGKTWTEPEVLPRERAAMAIACGGLQYGLSVFEGLKAFRGPEQGMHLFRPQDHARRLMASAQRLRLPEIPEDLFFKACRMAVRVHADFLPPHGRGALYLRPTLHADEESLGLKRASRHRFTVLVAACCDPPLKSLRMWAEPELIRAAAGGLGAAKTGANYAAGIGGLLRARERGYDDVIWLDAATHAWLGEAGTMNLFVQIGSQLRTPALDGTILAGITRDSLLQLARSMGLDVAETPISLEELRAAAQRGEAGGAFGCGTASRIVLIREIGTPQGDIALPDNGLPQKLATRLKALQEGGGAEFPQWRVAV